MVDQRKMKKVMPKQVVHKVMPITDDLILPNHSRGKAPESNKGLANKQYIDSKFPVTHASTTGQTTDDHHPQTHTIVSHDTTATGAELTSLTDDSITNALHRHSELSASDGSPDPALSVDEVGFVGIGSDAIATGVLYPLHVSITDANNTTVSSVAGIDHRLTSGVGANGIGTAFILSAENSIGGRNGMMRFVGRFDDVTAGTVEGACSLELNHHGAWTEALKLSETDCIISKNVGIGETSPDRTLHVNAAEINVVAKFESTDDIAAINIVDNDTSGYFTVQNNIISIGSKSSPNVDNINVNTTGNVGMGTTSPDTKLQVVGDCKFGDDNTNYSSFATDGILTMTGTARVNKEFSLLLSDFNPGASGPTKALNDIFPTYEFTIDDDMHTSFEMPDDWAVGTDLTCEVYWAINEAYADNSGEVRWSADWRAVAVGEVISGGASGTMDFGDVNIPATANTVVKTTSTIAGGSLSADDLVAFNGARVDLVAGNNPTAEPYIIAVRLEYIADKLGEAT